MSMTIHIRGLSTLFAGVSICIAGATWAAPNSDRFPISIADLEAKAAERFANIDSDKSGDIDMDEFEAAEMQHPHPGANRGEKQRHGTQKQEGSHADGHRAGKHRRGGSAGATMRAEMRAATQAELFSILDADEDGHLSQAEFTADGQRKARVQAQKRAVFKGLDRDGNSLLTADEFPRSLARLSAADVDQDGLITKAEMRALRAQHRSTRPPKAG